jgi:hypothetical protein
MNQMRAILGAAGWLFLLLCGRRDGSAFLRRQQSRSGGLFRRGIGVLRPCCGHAQQAHKAKNKGKTRPAARLRLELHPAHLHPLSNAFAEESALF